MRQKPQINIPAGKSIKTLSGKRTFKGPMVLQTTTAMKLQPTYCDGSRWQYKHQEDAAKLPKEDGTKKSTENKEIEKSEPDAKEAKPTEKSALKKEVKKEKKADVSNVSPKTKEKPAPTQGDEDNPSKRRDNSGNKKKKM